MLELYKICFMRFCVLLVICFFYTKFFSSEGIFTEKKTSNVYDIGICNKH